MTDCSLCPKVYGNVKNLNKHMKAEHPTEFQEEQLKKSAGFLCLCHEEDCSFKSKQRSELREHLQKVHEWEDVVIEKIFQNEAELITNSSV